MIKFDVKGVASFITVYDVNFLLTSSLKKKNKYISFVVKQGGVSMVQVA